MNDASADGNPPSGLSGPDRAALDWLCEHGWEATDPPPSLADRVEALRTLAELVSHGTNTADADLCERVAGLCVSPGLEPVLCEQDADALDAWMISGHRSERTPAGLRGRAASYDAVASLLAAGSSVIAEVTPISELTGRTLARIDAVSESGSPDASPARSHWRITDLVSIAAVLLISASVLWPVVGSARQHALREANRANLAVAGIGFGAYAAEHDDRLPSVSDGVRQPGWAWWRVGENPRESNSANFFTLHRAGYTPADALESPGNPNAAMPRAGADALDWETFEQVSYSMTLGDSLRLTRPDGTVLLADRSPITLAVYRGLPAYVDAGSPNHAGRGQQVLRADGSVVWLDRPALPSGDHIYLPRGLERIIRAAREGRRLTFEGIGTPEGERDAFVAP
ncbi:MAG: hypothetical protein AAGB48_00795 [Planctomycetota bacterium]